MRIAAGCTMFLMLAANAAYASEAFVTQVAHEVAATEATAASYLNAASASTLAAPLPAWRGPVTDLVRAAGSWKQRLLCGAVRSQQSCDRGSDGRRQPLGRGSTRFRQSGDRDPTPGWPLNSGWNRRSRMPAGPPTMRIPLLGRRW